MKIHLNVVICENCTGNAIIDVLGYTKIWVPTNGTRALMDDVKNPFDAESVSKKWIWIFYGTTVLLELLSTQSNEMQQINIHFRPHSCMIIRLYYINKHDEVRKLALVDSI